MRNVSTKALRLPWATRKSFSIRFRWACALCIFFTGTTVNQHHQPFNYYKKIKTWTSRPELDDFDIDAGSPALEKGLADCSWKHIKELCRAKICLWSPSISLPVKRKCYHVCRIQTATAWVLGNPRVGHAGVNVDISKRKSNPVGQFTSLDIDAPEGGGGKIDPHSRAQRW